MKAKRPSARTPQRPRYRWYWCETSMEAEIYAHGEALPCVAVHAEPPLFIAGAKKLARKICRLLNAAQQEH